MNSSSVSDVTVGGYQVSTIVLSVLFFTSEVLPFIKKNRGNGVLETVIALVRGNNFTNDDIADKLDDIKTAIDEKRDNPVTEKENDVKV